jgi:phage baseplate assembly protein W
MIERPHLKFPFTLDPATNTVQVVEQDTPEHVMSCELVIVHYPAGTRADRPEFGWAWPDMQTMPLDLTPLQQALERFEPRGQANVAQHADLAASLVTVEAQIAIRSSDTGTPA